MKILEIAVIAVKTNRSLHPFFFHIVFQRTLFVAYVLFCYTSFELLPAARASGERPGHSPGTQSGDGIPCTPAFN